MNDFNKITEIGMNDFNKITEIGKAMLSWFKENVENEFPCSQCGSKTINNGFDTDSAFISCLACGNVETITFDLIKKRIGNQNGK